MFNELASELGKTVAGNNNNNKDNEIFMSNMNGASKRKKMNKNEEKPLKH
jgi:hypothetical protein